MVCYRSWRFVELPHCRGVEKTFGVLVPILELCWEISVKNVTCHRGDFKSCLVAFENTVKDVDRKGTSKACCFCELSPTKRLSDTQRNRWFLRHHHHNTRLFYVLDSWSCCVAEWWYLVIISRVSFHLAQKRRFIFLDVLIKRLFLLFSWQREPCFSSRKRHLRVTFL